jgi:hypothetical protein
MSYNEDRKQHRLVLQPSFPIPKPKSLGFWLGSSSVISLGAVVLDHAYIYAQSSGVIGDLTYVLSWRSAACCM